MLLLSSFLKFENGTTVFKGTFDSLWTNSDNKTREGDKRNFQKEKPVNIGTVGYSESATTTA